MAFSSFKQTDDTSVFDAGKVYDWLRENKIAEFIDFTDVGDGEYIELGIKIGASPETLITLHSKSDNLHPRRERLSSEYISIRAGIPIQHEIATFNF